ncbi:MAG: ribose transporter ATP-binding protein [Armatimonadetes bacterium]|nr:ribose transporter ATP-binding protein [Armatimonadota bacterium]
MNRRLVLIGGAAVLVAAPGCKKKKEKDVAPAGVKIGLVLPESTSPFYQAVTKSLEKVAAERQIEVIATDAKGKASEQVGAIEQALQRKVSVIVVSPVDPDIVRPAIEKAIEQNVYVVLLERPLENVDVSSAVAFNHELAGKLLADYLGKKLTSGGKVGVISGARTPGEKKRLQAFQAYLKEKYPSIKVAAEQTAREESEQAGAAQRLLAVSGLDAVVALNPLAGTAVVAAARKRAGKPLVITYGGRPALIEELRKSDSPLELVLEPLPNWLGDRAGRMAWRIISNKATPSAVELPAQPVTRDNLDAYHGWDGVLPENMAAPWETDLSLEVKRDE